MQNLLIRNGYVLDPESGFEGKADVLVKDGKIAAVGSELAMEAGRVFDAEGLTVLPGLVDMHVHFRDPGQEYKEDIESGARAAAHGGVTSVLAMPNTKPVMDNGDRIRYVVNKARAVAPIHVYQAGAITQGMKGEALAPLTQMAEKGARAFSEDGKSVMNAKLLREAMKIAKTLGIPVCSHCEDLSLVDGGVMNDDENALRLGLPGIPNASEDVIIGRDILLAKDTGAHLHLCHCSTKGSVDLIRFAKSIGVDISAETCPHYLILTSDDIPSDDGNFKMNPPLRTKEDREALRLAVQDGLIDVLVTDHAPHAATEKGMGFRGSPFGIVGIETSAALLYTHLVKTGLLPLMELVRKMSTNPAKILGIPAGSLSVGAPADIAVFDFAHSYRIRPQEFVSKGKNTPFANREVYGKTMLTVCDGQIVWENKK